MLIKNREEWMAVYKALGQYCENAVNEEESSSPDSVANETEAVCAVLERMDQQLADIADNADYAG